MDPRLFTRPSGELTPLIGGGVSFVPARLPPRIDTSQVVDRLAKALMAIGELKGAARRLSNPWLLIQPMQRLEALTTSAMEGTYTTLNELVMEEAEVATGSADTREVANFIRALHHAAARVEEGWPIAHRLLCETHAILLKGVRRERGGLCVPGQYKHDQNAIGGTDIANARFVPPPPDLTPRLMADLERFINDRPPPEPMQALIDIAIVHYQFEAIHPFADGNGRMGRMLITLLARTWGLLDHMLLYVSPELEEQKQRYIDLLFDVSARSRWEEWIGFLAEVVARSCHRIITTIDDLLALHADFRERAQQAGRSANLQAIVDMLFEVPVVTVPLLERKLGMTYAGVQRLLRVLEKQGILVAVPETRPRAYMASEIVDLTQRRI